MEIGCKIVSHEIGREIEAEYKNIWEIDNPHIVRVYGAIIEENMKCMILLMERIVGFDC